MFILWLLGIFSLLLYIYNRAIKNVVIVEKMFTGPKRFPLLGSALEMMTTQEGMYRKAVELHTKYNFQVLPLWLFHKLFLFTADSVVVEAILSSDKTISKAKEYEVISPLAGDSIFTADGTIWKSHRKLMTPAFHLKILQGFQDVFYKNSQIMIGKYIQHDGQGSFDIHGYNILNALDNVCETAMGTSVKAQNDPDLKYVKALNTVLDTFYARVFFPWYRLDFIFNRTKLGRFQKRSLDIVHNFTTDIINKRKEERKKLAENPNLNDDEDLDIKKRKVILDVVLDAAEEENWSDNKLRSEVDPLMVAGHDTIGSALDFIFFSLSQNQNVQDKVCEELQAILGDEERCPTYQELQSMKYLERVIKESMRLYPPTLIFGRHIKENLPLGDGRYIPAGVDIFVNVLALHQNPKMYENASTFDPDRWIPKEMEKRHPFAYMVFSAGPRNCIGQKFAMLQLKITIASVLRKLHFLPCKLDEMPKLKIGAFLTSANGVNVKVRARQR